MNNQNKTKTVQKEVTILAPAFNEENNLTICTKYSSKNTK